MSNALNEITERIVRYGDLLPCKTAFIDAHTPGSDQKENFTIIGGGVSESADQHVHINIPMDLILVRLGNHLDVEIRYIHTEPQKCSLYYQVVGGSSGVDGEKLEKWF